MVSVGRVTTPSGDHEHAIEVTTDYPVASEASFYLRPDSPLPLLGASIIYGDHHAWFAIDGRTVTARKLGMNHDGFAPLR